MPLNSIADGNTAGAAPLSFALGFTLAGCVATPPFPDGVSRAETLVGCCGAAQDLPTRAGEMTFGPLRGREGPGDIPFAAKVRARSAADLAQQVARNWPAPGTCANPANDRQ